MADPTIDHADHDALLIASYAAGDVAGEDVVRAEALVAGCEDCRLLALDLRSIASATRDLGGWHATAARDFRISPEEAERARRLPLIRRLSTRLGLGDAVIRPAGLGLAALGLVGILVTGAGLGSPTGTGTGSGTSGGGGYAAQLAASDARAGGTAEAAAAPAASATGAVRDSRTGGSGGLAAPSPQREPAITARTMVGAASIVLLVLGVLLWLAPSWRRRGR